MTASNPAKHIPRRSVDGQVRAMWAKMFDPPTESPPTPELVPPTNPVPEFMQATMPGIFNVSVPHTVQRDLLHGITKPMYDGKPVLFYSFRDSDNTLDTGNYPAATIRVPRGEVYHAQTQGHGPPPHTIHWHGIEPTPINDGVGHCSMEIGQYTYQWQPNHIGTYFYHCHRNTVQHFEFGLFGMLFIEPPDAYAQQNPALPNYAGGYPRRTAACLAGPGYDFTADYPGWEGGSLTDSDPGGVYATNPHAMTVPYDVEALWVLDDTDSAWRELASNARATYPQYGPNPGVDDNFFGNWGGANGVFDFFSFHDFNPDYFHVTGVNFPGPLGSTAAIPEGVVIPKALNSGVEGMQVSVNAQVDQTILIRSLCAAYVNCQLSFPIDVLVIGYDGRGLGVPPFGNYNQPFLLPAGETMHMSTASRYDVLMRSSTPVNDVATAEFLHNRDPRHRDPDYEPLIIGQIPIVIS